MEALRICNVADQDALQTELLIGKVLHVADEDQHENMLTMLVLAQLDCQTVLKAGKFSRFNLEVLINDSKVIGYYCHFLLPTNITR